MYVTTAPESYDYWYVKTDKILGKYKGKEVRQISHNDEMRFEGFQRPRYSSGLYFCWPIDGEEAKHVLCNLDKE